MAELKTQKHEGDVDAFLASVENDVRRVDAESVKEIMTRLSGEEPVMWGDSIVGFGSYSYRTRDGKTHSWFRTGFSPRTQSLTLYIMDGFKDYDELLAKLGPHSTGKACLYIRDLEKVDRHVLEELIAGSLRHVSEETDQGLDSSLPTEDY